MALVGLGECLQQEFDHVVRTRWLDELATPRPAVVLEDSGELIVLNHILDQCLVKVVHNYVLLVLPVDEQVADPPRESLNELV